MTMYDLIRSFGRVAYLAFSLSMALGIASLSGGLSERALDRRVIRQLLHRSAAVVGLIALAVHLALTVLDSYVSTSVTAVLVPFTAGYKVLALGIGSLALYGFLGAAGSGWLRLTTARLFSERGWRWLHRVAYAGWGLCLLHGILAGPDTGSPWALASYALGVAMVAVGFGVHRAGVRHVLRRDFDGAIRFREAR
jgi:sulfoxide reductase heme-binding subunit YedZ